MTRPALKDALVSVVVPVFNEAHVLGELHDRIHKTLTECGSGLEIIFVNDGSSDGSTEILDALARRHPHVRVLHLARNFGHQSALHAGLSHARGDAVVLMDADMQDPPEAIKPMVAEWLAGYDVVYAVRCDRPEAVWKRCLFAGFHRLLAAVASTPIPADAGNFSIIDARVVRQLVSLGETDRYLPGLRSWVGFKQRGIEISRGRRYDNQPRVSLRGLWRLAKTAIFSFSSFPLTLFYIIGYSALALFLALGSYALVCKIFTDLAVPGWTSNVLVASFFGAVNALGICILGEYVIRIYDQVRARPTYIVDETRNLHPAADHAWPDRRSTPRGNADRRGADRRGGVSAAWPGTQGAEPHFDSFDSVEGDGMALDVEFEAAHEMITGFTGELESEEEYEALMAEAEELLGMTQPYARGPRLLQAGDCELTEDELAELADVAPADVPETNPAESNWTTRGQRAHSADLRPFHDTWALDEEWPIDEVGPVTNEQQPVTKWSTNRPLPAGAGPAPSESGPARPEARPSEPERSPESSPAAPQTGSAQRKGRKESER